MLYKTSKQALFNHLRRVRAIAVVKSKNDKKNVEILEAEINKLSQRHSILTNIRILAFVLLYASVAGAFVGGWQLLRDIVQTFSVLGSFLGVGILSLIVLYLTWRMNQLWSHMLIVYGHLVAIYEKYSTKALQKE